MPSEGISLNIVENSTSDMLTKRDQQKAWCRPERRRNPKTREDKVQFHTKFLHYKLENVKQRPIYWLAFIQKKRNELTNTGHIMDDETFITHLWSSLPQADYEGVIIVIKERLRSSSCDLNRNMSKLKGWTLQSSLFTLWMEKTRVDNQTKIDDDENLLKTF